MNPDSLANYKLKVYNPGSPYPSPRTESFKSFPCRQKRLTLVRRVFCRNADEWKLLLHRGEHPNLRDLQMLPCIQIRSWRYAEQFESLAVL